MKPMIIKVCKLLIFADGYGNNIILMQILYKVYGVMLFKYVPIVLAPFQHNYLFLYILLYMMADIFTSQLQNLL